MIKFDTERPAETVYPTLYDEFEISKRPIWPLIAAKEKAAPSSRIGNFFKFFGRGIRPETVSMPTNRSPESLNDRTTKS